MSALLLDRGFRFNLGVINMFLLIASTGGVWVSEHSKLLNLICICVVSMSLALVQKQHIPLKSLYAIGAFLLVSAVLIIHYLLANAIYAIEPTNYINLCIRVMYAVFVYIYFDICRINMINALRWILTAILIHSIINFVALQFIIPIEFLRRFGSGETSVKTFLYIFYSWQSSNVMNVSIIRSQGLFWEPGVLQVFLNLLLYIELNLFRASKYKILLIGIAVLITFSTTGYVIALVILVSYGIKHGYGRLSIGSISKVTLIAVPLSLVLYMNVIDKLSLYDSYSLAYRLFDLEKSVHIIRSHPLLGLGFSTEAYPTYQFGSDALALSGQGIQETFISDAGNTNSILFLFVSFGAVLSIMYLTALYKQSVFNIMPIVVFSCLLLTSFSEPLLTNNMFLFLFVSGCVRIFLKLDQDRRLIVDWLRT